MVGKGATKGSSRVSSLGSWGDIGIFLYEEDTEVTVILWVKNYDFNFAN